MKYTQFACFWLQLKGFGVWGISHIVCLSCRFRKSPKVYEWLTHVCLQIRRKKEEHCKLGLSRYQFFHHVQKAELDIKAVSKKTFSNFYFWICLHTLALGRRYNLWLHFGEFTHAFISLFALCLFAFSIGDTSHPCYPWGASQWSFSESSLGSSHIYYVVTPWEKSK